MTDLVALLDRPSSESMGALPIVSVSGGSGLAVHGLATSAKQQIADDDLRELLASHQAIGFHPPVPVDFGSEVSNAVAMWIGREFEAKAINLGVPAPPLPSEQVVRVPDGQAAVANSAEVYARLEAWLERAFRAVVGVNSNQALARLMAQVLPDHEFTQAALWHSAVSERERSQEIDWFMRLRRDLGKRTSRSHLEHHFKTLCRQPPWTSVKGVVLVSGLAGTRHSEAAEQLTKTIRAHVHDSSMVSFGRFLRDRWQDLHGSAPTKPDLQKFGQQQVDAGPFLFARQVLAQTHAYPELLVVDGVRHGVIKEAIEFIVNKPTLDLGVYTPEALVVKHLTTQVGAAWVSGVRAAQTEDEAKKLLEQVSQRIRYTDSDSENQSEVKRVSDLALEKFAAAG
jgi:hypothetical protein